MHEIRVGILGPAVVVQHGTRRELGASRHRALLTVLAAHRGRRVPTEAIVEALWGEAPPATAATTLQGYVADLRRVLEPRRAPRTPATVLVTEPGGYALRLDEEAVDASRFEAVVRRAGSALSVLLPGPAGGPAADPDAHPAGDTGRRAALADWRDELDEALALWRGEPLCDLGPAPELDVERDRLRALRLDAEVLRLTAVLGLGGDASATTDLERLARHNPWDERIWTLWATALAQTGRQAEALARLRELRTALTTELGLDAGPEVGALETAILRHEVSPPARAVTPAPARSGAPPAAGEWPLVGRREERALLGRLLELATTGPQLLHLTGEHGLGKTRLAREVERYAHDRGFAVVSAGCARAAVREELWAWRRLAYALGAVAGLPPGAAPGSAPGAAPGTPRDAPLQPPTRPPVSAVEAAEEVLGLVGTITATRPLLLVLEDLQWADQTTLVALAHLVASRPEAPYLLLLTQRLAPVPSSSALAGLLGALGRAHGTHHALGGLSVDEVGDLLSSVRLAPVARSAVEQVARRSQGNPFVVVELARHGRLLGGPLPASVRDVVVHALRGLPSATTDLLHGASLLDPTFDAALLADAAGLDPAGVFDVLGPAVAAGVLREETRYRYSFEVGVVREVLAESLTPITRARWQADLALAAARRRSRVDDVPDLLPCPPPVAATAPAGARYDHRSARMYPS